MGTPDLYKYIEKYNIKKAADLDQRVGTHSKKSFTKFINEKNQHLVSDEAIDLMEQMIVYDHDMRITPKDAMEHPYFRVVRESNDASSAIMNFINEK